MKLAAGDVPAGKLHFVGPLAAGGMGQIWLGCNRATLRRRAIVRVSRDPGF